MSLDTVLPQMLTTAISRLRPLGCAVLSGSWFVRAGWVVLLGLVLAPTASAQKVWTLNECLAYAQNHNLQVQQASLLQDKSAVQLDAAKKSFLPTVDARVRSNGNWGFLIDPSTNELSDQFNFGNRAALNFNLNLFDGFATASQVKLRRQQLAVAGYVQQMSTNAVSLETIYSFLQVVLGQEQLANSRLRAAYLTEQQRKVKMQVEKGMLSKRDLLNLQSQVAAEELLTVYAENSIEQALFTLKQVIGLPFTEDVAVQPVQINDQWLTTELSSDKVLATAATALPDLKAVQARIEAAHYAWQLGRAAYKPVLALTAQVATRTSNYKPEGFETQVVDNLNRRIGLSLNMPLFNRFQLQSTDQLAKLDIEAAKVSYQQVDRELSGKIRNALLACKAAAKKYQALQLQYEVVSEEHRYAAKMLELGGIDAVEYSVTRSRLVTAQSEMVQAKYDCFFKQQIVRFYQGESLAF